MLDLLDVALLEWTEREISIVVIERYGTSR
jgi:hypothetical protein